MSDKTPDFAAARNRDLECFLVEALAPNDDDLTIERLKDAYRTGMIDLMLRIKAGEEPCYKLHPARPPLGCDGLPEGLSMGFDRQLPGRLKTGG